MKRNLQWIQALRAVAALMVLMFHLKATFDISPYLTGLGAWTKWGFAGVDVFFAISGFVVYRSAKAARGEYGMAGFCGRRFARIYFGYWPVIIVGTVIWLVAFHRPPLNARHMVKSFLLLYPNIMDNWLPTAWSLTFELWFYLWIAVAVYLTKNPLRAVTAMMIGVVLWNAGWLAHDRIGVYNGATPLGFAITGFGVEFLAGALIAELYERHRELFCTFSVMAPLTVALMLVGLTIGTVVPEFDHVPLLRAGTFGLFGVGCLLFALGLGEMRHAPPRWLSKIGDASYSLYLLHPLLIDCSSPLRGTLPADSPVLLAAFLLALPVTFVIASLAWYQWVELPGVRLARRLFPQPRLSVSPSDCGTSPASSGSPAAAAATAGPSGRR